MWQRRESLSKLAEPLQGALASGGVIILITAAGGAFGGMLQQDWRCQYDPRPASVFTVDHSNNGVFRHDGHSHRSGFRDRCHDHGRRHSLRDSHHRANWACHPVYLALAIGCGSKPIAWMNDSGFWVICKMSGMTEGEGLRFVTPMSILMGLVGLAATLLAASVWPMV